MTRLASASTTGFTTCLDIDININIDIDIDIAIDIDIDIAIDIDIDIDINQTCFSLDNRLYYLRNWLFMFN